MMPLIFGTNLETNSTRSPKYLKQELTRKLKFTDTEKTSSSRQTLEQPLGVRQEPRKGHLPPPRAVGSPLAVRAPKSPSQARSALFPPALPASPPISMARLPCPTQEPTVCPRCRETHLPEICSRDSLTNGSYRCSSPLKR